MTVQQSTLYLRGTNMMININQLIRSGTTVASRNAPAILTAFGAIGVVGTAVLAAKASFEAADRITKAEFKAKMEDGEKHTPFTKAEKVKLVWPLYVAAVSTGALSCGAILMSHRISSRRAAVLAAAYALNQDKLEEYQDKIKEKFGVKEEKAARSELHQEKIDRDFEHDTEHVFSPLDGKVLIREDYTGRYFWSTVEAVDKAVNEINANVLREGSARLSDFYDVVGLKHVSTSDYFGFVRDNPIELEWDTGVTPDKKIAIHTFEYVHHPVMNPELEAKDSFR